MWYPLWIVTRTVASPDPPAEISRRWAAAFTTLSDVIFWAAGDAAGAFAVSGGEFEAGLEQAALTNRMIRQQNKSLVDRLIMFSRWCVYSDFDSGVEPQCESALAARSACDFLARRTK